MNPTTDSNDPHAGQPVRALGVPLDEASAAVVMLHGRGASAESILELGRVLDVPGVAYLAPQAAGATWYPQRFLAPRAANEPALSSALTAVQRTLEHIESAGVPARRIVLVGFSQGACLTAETLARRPRRFGGAAILTGGLIGETIDATAYAGSLDGTPVLLTGGDPDAHVPWRRVEQTAGVLSRLGAAVDTHRYPGRPHTVSQDEARRLRELLQAVRGQGDTRGPVDA